MKRKQPEAAIAAAINQYMELRAKPGVVWFHIPNGGLRNARVGAMLRRQGVKAGVPDLCFVNAGRIFFLELKVGTGRMSQAQFDMQARLYNAGAYVLSAYGMDDAINTIKEWGLVR